MFGHALVVEVKELNNFFNYLKNFKLRNAQSEKNGNERKNEINVK